MDIKVSFAVVNAEDNFYAKYANTLIEKTVAHLDTIDTCYVVRTVGQVSYYDCRITMGFHDRSKFVFRLQDVREYPVVTLLD